MASSQLSVPPLTSLCPFFRPPPLPHQGLSYMEYRSGAGRGRGRGKLGYVTEKGQKLFKSLVAKPKPVP